MLGYLGGPLLSPTCRAPPRFATSASLGDTAAFRPPSGGRRPCHRVGRVRGDHASGVHRGADWHGPLRLIVVMG
jgi:hypothetical protein